MVGPGTDPAAPSRPLSLLVVEDDRADALLVEELIADANADMQVVWAQSMADAERALADGSPGLRAAGPEPAGRQRDQRPRPHRQAGRQRARRRADRPDRRALRGLGGGVGRPGLSGQGARRTRDAAPRGAVRHRAQARRAHRGRTARESDDGTGERPPGPRAATHAAAARRPGGRHRRAVPARARGTPCSAATSTTSSRLRTARSTSWWATWPDTVPTRPRSGVALRIGWRALTFAGLRGNERMRQLERILRAESPAAASSRR